MSQTAQSAPSIQRGEPDVSVILAVYNTMPYLTRCLESIVGQSIGRSRLQVIAVDDGSTDASGRELDRFASRYPDVFTIVHQPNSGSPARPSNRALELATGRYVFFVGADDYLGPQALQRLVEAADEWGSDVVLGKMVGVNSRYVHQAVFAGNQVDIDLFDSPLPYSLSNTKLFRRELIDKYGLRYPENMPVGSDQPFTLEACLRARRISVLSDYDFYFAVRRLNAHNITYRSEHTLRLRCLDMLMGHVADLIAEGGRRDAVLVRHFAWELAKLVEDDYRDLDRAEQERVRSGVADLVRRYLTPTIATGLKAEIRIRLLVAQRGDVDDLLAVIDSDARQGVARTVFDRGRVFAAYPGFGAGTVPDEVFDVTDVAPTWLAKLDATAARWESGPKGRVLVVDARSPVPDLVAHCTAPPRIKVGEVSAATTVGVAAESTALTARFAVDTLLAGNVASGRRRGLLTTIDTAVGSGTAPMRAPALVLPRPVLCRRGRRFYVVTPAKDRSGQFMIAVVPVTARRVLARLRRLRPWRGRSKQ